MKTKLLPLLVLFWLTHCNTAQKENDSEPVKQETARLDSAKSPAILGRDPISIESTVELSVLLMEEETLLAMARFEAYGGVFEASAFAEQSSKIAVRLWYCFNTTDRTLPRFFLALEHIDIITYDELNPEKMDPTNDVFIVPEVFQYDQPDIEPTTVERFIANHTAKTTAAAQTINRNQVQTFSNNFKTYMASISPGGSKRPYCKYAVAVFKYDPAYKQFFTLLPQPRWVRYYLGLARDPDHRPNYLRPVLAGVDEHGNTIVIKNRGDEPFLQKSVPPPPYQ